jgi:hypothetical protein
MLNDSICWLTVSETVNTLPAGSYFKVMMVSPTVLFALM